MNIEDQVDGKTMVIDFSSPVAMHIGHMRSTIIGHTIDQMYRAAGYKVVADNHIEIGALSSVS